MNPEDVEAYVSVGCHVGVRWMRDLGDAQFAPLAQEGNWRDGVSLAMDTGEKLVRSEMWPSDSGDFHYRVYTSASEAVGPTETGKMETWEAVVDRLLEELP